MNDNKKSLKPVAIAATAGLVVGVVLAKKFGVKPQTTLQVIEQWTEEMQKAGFTIFAFNREQVNYLNHLQGVIAEMPVKAA